MTILQGENMKKTIAALLAVITLTSCGASAVVAEPQTASVNGNIISAGMKAVKDAKTDRALLELAEKESRKKNSEEQKENNNNTNEDNKGEEVFPDPEMPNEVFYLDVPYFSQAEYPTGCELVSTSMLLAYYGIDITAGELIDNGYIETGSVYQDPKNSSKLRGGDPNKVFIGDPYDEGGFGCYSGAIVSGLENILADEQYADKSLEIRDLSGMAMKDICSEYIDKGMPVLIWASINMVPTEKKESNTWYLDDTDKEFTWTSNEHCLLLVGYNADYYYLHDPLRQEATLYERKLTEKRYSELGKQAITLIPHEKEEPDAVEEEAEDKEEASDKEETEENTEAPSEEAAKDKKEDEKQS